MASNRIVREVMTENPAYCMANTPIRTVARMMVEHDCGEIPVLDANGFPIGVVTDRDICCRVVADGRAVDEVEVTSCMSTPCVTIRDDASVEECCRLLEEHQIRRVPVVDAGGRCCGIVAQADLASSLDVDKTGRVVRAVSRSRTFITSDGPSAR